MKIGIITMHGVKNFGSFLQTYATQKMLESLGHDVSVIHYMSANRRFKSLLMHVSSPQWQRNIFTRFIYRLCYAPKPYQSFDI